MQSPDARGADTIVVTGRFQPIHVDHLDLMRRALGMAPHLIVGITNADAGPRVEHPASAHRHRPESNPFDYAQRRRLVEAALLADGVSSGKFTIVPFPLDEPEAWPRVIPRGALQLVRVFSDWEREKVRRFEAAGWSTVVLEGDPAARISASDIRDALRAGRPWQHVVPPGARELLAAWSSTKTA